MRQKLKASILIPPIKVESYKGLFLALGKALFHGWKGQFDDAYIDVLDAGATIGLDNTEEKLAWKLVNRSGMQAVSDLVKDNRGIFESSDEETITKSIKKLRYDREITVDINFFEHPKECQFVKDMQEVLLEWFILVGIDNNIAKAVASKFPRFFVYSLRDEWVNGAGIYKKLLAPMETPVSGIAAMEDDWARYRACLEMLTEENIFGSAISLSQMYIPLCAYYEKHNDGGSSSRDKHYDGGSSRGDKRYDGGRSSEDKHHDGDSSSGDKRYDGDSLKRDTHDVCEEKSRGDEKKRIVVKLDDYMRKWLDKEEREDAIRLISGEPGSGKSSFAKMFVSSVADTHETLFVPLYLLDFRRDVKDVVGEFLTANRYFRENPIGNTDQLLIVFDGLDEIMMQGKACVEAARDFISQVQCLLSNHNNNNKLRLRVIITGRDLSIQEIESFFRKEGQILHILPYYIPEKKEDIHENVSQKGLTKSELVDDDNLLDEDKRQLWWRNYGELTGRGYGGLPADFSRPELDDITSRPLLNYLLALSHDRGFQFSDATNLNELYEDLLNSVYERGWQSSDRNISSHMNREDYEKVMEEIAVSVWQGAGRTTTVSAIKERCKRSNLMSSLQVFLSKAENDEKGIVSLLTAFYFRQSGERKGDKTFEFTHKSFHEFLAARRIVRQLVRTKKAISQHKEDQSGWTLEAALENWIHLCSNEPMDIYIFRFLSNEIRRQKREDVVGWQEMLCELISYMLRNGMPYEKMSSTTSFYHQTRQSRNSEEALLATLSACALYTEKVSDIKWPDVSSAGEWLSKLCGQRTVDFVFPYSCLNHIGLRGQVLKERDLLGANLSDANLSDADLIGANLRYADLSGADLSHADLSDANLNVADLRGTDLSGAYLSGANLGYADLRSANLSGAYLNGTDLNNSGLSGASLSSASLRGASLCGAGLPGTDLRDADLYEADLRKAKLNNADMSGAYLVGADLSRAKLFGTKLRFANLHRAVLQSTKLPYAVLSHADLSHTDMSDADLRGADLSYANLRQAHLSCADLGNTNLSGTDLRQADLRQADLQGAFPIKTAIGLSEAKLDGAILDEEQTRFLQSIQSENKV